METGTGCYQCGKGKETGNAEEAGKVTGRE